MFTKRTPIPQNLISPNSSFVEQDVFAYVLQTNRELNFSLKDARVIHPFKGRLFVNQNNYPDYLLKISKNGRISSSKISVAAHCKPSLKIFLTLEEMIAEYEKDLLLVKKTREDVLKYFLEFESECDKNLMNLLEQ